MAALPGLLLLCLAATARGHGGMIWPPVWQDGSNNTIAWLDLVNSTKIASEPMVVDPNTGKPVSDAKQFLTDQIYLGGHGPQYQTEGKKDMPWKAPGFAMNFGGGCGVFGGNPYGCPAHLDTRVSDPTKGRKNDIKCGQPSMGYNRRGTFAFGSDARELEFPQMRTTEWARGSVQTVAWLSGGYHNGGYIYRLCKLGPEGRKGLTEDCFSKTPLAWASPTTTYRSIVPGQDRTWRQAQKTDKTETTFPVGSAWRPVTKKGKNPGLVRKDEVVVPSDLPTGEYALAFRWDTMAPQIWVSCASVKIV